MSPPAWDSTPWARRCSPTLGTEQNLLPERAPLHPPPSLQLMSEEVRSPATTAAKPQPRRQLRTYGLHHFEVQAGQGRQADHRLPPDPAVAVRLAGLRRFAGTRTRLRRVTAGRGAAGGLVLGSSWRCDGSRPHAELGCPLLGVPCPHRAPPSPACPERTAPPAPLRQPSQKTRNRTLSEATKRHLVHGLVNGKNKQQQLLPAARAAPRARGRISRLSSASQPSGFDVWEDLPDDLAEIGGAQGATAEVIAVSPAGRATG